MSGGNISSGQHLSNIAKRAGGAFGEKDTGKLKSKGSIGILKTNSGELKFQKLPISKRIKRAIYKTLGIKIGKTSQKSVKQARLDTVSNFLSEQFRDKAAEGGKPLKDFQARKLPVNEYTIANTIKSMPDVLTKISKGKNLTSIDLQNIMLKVADSIDPSKKSDNPVKPKQKIITSDFKSQESSKTNRPKEFNEFIFHSLNNDYYKNGIDLRDEHFNKSTALPKAINDAIKENPKLEQKIIKGKKITASEINLLKNKVVDKLNNEGKERISNFLKNEIKLYTKETISDEKINNAVSNFMQNPNNTDLIENLIPLNETSEAFTLMDSPISLSGKDIANQLTADAIKEKFSDHPKLKNVPTEQIKDAFANLKSKDRAQVRESLPEWGNDSNLTALFNKLTEPKPSAPIPNPQSEEAISKSEVPPPKEFTPQLTPLQIKADNIRKAISSDIQSKIDELNTQSSSYTTYLDDLSDIYNVINDTENFTNEENLGYFNKKIDEFQNAPTFILNTYKQLAEAFKGESTPNLDKITQSIDNEVLKQQEPLNPILTELRIYEKILDDPSVIRDAYASLTSEQRNALDSEINTESLTPLLNKITGYEG